MAKKRNRTNKHTGNYEILKRKKELMMGQKR